MRPWGSNVKFEGCGSPRATVSTCTPSGAVISALAGVGHASSASTAARGIRPATRRTLARRASLAGILLKAALGAGRLVAGVAVEARAQAEAEHSNPRPEGWPVVHATRAATRASRFSSMGQVAL